MFHLSGPNQEQIPEGIPYSHCAMQLIANYGTQCDAVLTIS